MTQASALFPVAKAAAYAYASSVKKEGVAPCSETNCVAYSNRYLARKQSRNDMKLPSLAKCLLSGSVERT